MQGLDRGSTYDNGRVDRRLADRWRFAPLGPENRRKCCWTHDWLPLQSLSLTFGVKVGMARALAGSGASGEYKLFGRESGGTAAGWARFPNLEKSRREATWRQGWPSGIQTARIAIPEMADDEAARELHGSGQGDGNSGEDRQGIALEAADSGWAGLRDFQRSPMT